MMMMVVVVVRCSYFDAQTKGYAPKLSGDISYIGTKPNASQELSFSNY